MGIWAADGVDWHLCREVVECRRRLRVEHPGPRGVHPGSRITADLGTTAALVNAGGNPLQPSLRRDNVLVHECSGRPTSLGDSFNAVFIHVCLSLFPLSADFRRFPRPGFALRYLDSNLRLCGGTQAWSVAIVYSPSWMLFPDGSVLSWPVRRG